MYIMLTGPSVALFINAYGLYDDTWSAYAEGSVNILITISVGLKYGLIGILLGKVVSLILFAVIWRPIYLYRKGFKESTCFYWKSIFTHLLILTGCLLTNHTINKILNWIIQPSIGDIILYIICITLPILLLYSFLVFLFTPGAKDLLYRLPIIKKNNIIS